MWVTADATRCAGAQRSTALAAIVSKGQQDTEGVVKILRDVWLMHGVESVDQSVELIR